MARPSILPSKAFIGTAIGALLFVVLGLLVDTLWLVLLVYAAVVLLGYILGAVTVPIGRDSHRY